MHTAKFLNAKHSELWMETTTTASQRKQVYKLAHPSQSLLGP
jgi:hypothetical protein